MDNSRANAKNISGGKGFNNTIPSSNDPQDRRHAATNGQINGANVNKSFPASYGNEPPNHGRAPPNFHRFGGPHRGPWYPPDEYVHQVDYPYPRAYHTPTRPLGNDRDRFSHDEVPMFRAPRNRDEGWLRADENLPVAREPIEGRPSRNGREYPPTGNSEVQERLPLAASRDTRKLKAPDSRNQGYYAVEEHGGPRNAERTLSDAEDRKYEDDRCGQRIEDRIQEDTNDRHEKDERPQLASRLDSACCQVMEGKHSPPDRSALEDRRRGITDDHNGHYSQDPERGFPEGRHSKYMEEETQPHPEARGGIRSDDMVRGHTEEGNQTFSDGRATVGNDERQPHYPNDGIPHPNYQPDFIPYPRFGEDPRQFREERPDYYYNGGQPYEWNYPYPDDRAFAYNAPRYGSRPPYDYPPYFDQRGRGDMFHWPPYSRGPYPVLAPRRDNPVLESSRRKRHYCELCRRDFPKKANLVIHQRVHGNDRPFHCKHEGCGKQYRWKVWILVCPQQSEPYLTISIYPVVFTYTP